MWFFVLCPRLLAYIFQDLLTDTRGNHMIVPVPIWQHGKNEYINSLDPQNIISKHTTTHSCSYLMIFYLGQMNPVDWKQRPEGRRLIPADTIIALGWWTGWLLIKFRPGNLVPYWTHLLLCSPKSFRIVLSTYFCSGIEKQRTVS